MSKYSTAYVTVCLAAGRCGARGGGWRAMKKLIQDCPATNDALWHTGPAP